MVKHDFTPISNIITEMIMKGATLKELDRIVEYSRKLIDCERAYIENDIPALIEKYCKEEPVVRACAEKRIDLNEEFAKVLDRGPEHHANDYVHFKEPDGFHFGRVASYNPATMEYRVYDLGEGTMYLVAAKNIISESEEVKKDGE